MGVCQEKMGWGRVFQEEGGVLGRHCDSKGHGITRQKEGDRGGW